MKLLIWSAPLVADVMVYFAGKLSTLWRTSWRV